MTALKPYLNYLKINMKTYFLVTVGVMAIILVIAFSSNLAYLNHIRSGAGPKETAMSFGSLYGSIAGVAMVYGMMLSITEFNTMMNMRADRKSIIISSIVSLIEYTLASMVVFVIMIKGAELLLEAMSPVPLILDRLSMMGYIVLIVVQSSVGLVLGALFYRFGGIKVMIGITIIASIVLLFGVSSSSFIQALGYKILYYIEIALENYEVILTVIFTLLMYTIYWLIMRKAPIKEYSKKNFLRIDE